MGSATVKAGDTPLRAVLVAKDSQGNPVIITPPPQWSETADGIATCVPDQDGMGATFSDFAEGSVFVNVVAPGAGQSGQDIHAQGDITVKPGSPATQSPLTLRAVFNLSDGTNFEVKASDGVDAGDYVGEFVHQKCIRCLVPGKDFTVFFRRDADGSRPEIVVERGKLFDKSIPAAQITTPFTVAFYDGATLLKTINAPAHWLFARFRWPNTPRPMVRTVATLRAKGWIPNYSKNTPIKTDPVTFTLIPYANPMDMCGEHFNADTGERNEIGPFTEQQSEVILNGNQSALAQMFANAEVTASVAIHMRDETTGAPLNVQAHPYMSTNKNSTSADKFIDVGPKTDPRYHTPETSHTPDNCSLPHMLTDDPYYLEEMQFTSNLGSTFSALYPAMYKLPGLASVDQTRAFGWSLRGQFRAAKFSPESPPSWLLPASVFRANLADSRTYTNRVMASPARVHSLFRQLPRTGTVGAWQNDFISFDVSLGIELGFTEWQPFYDWHLSGVLALVDGKSGWNRNFPTSDDFYDQFKTAGLSKVAIFDTSMDAQTWNTWGEIWAFYKSNNNFDDAGWDDSLRATSSGPAYFFYLWGCLVQAIRHGHPEVQAILDWYAPKLGIVKKPDGTVRFDASKISGFAKWSVAV